MDLWQCPKKKVHSEDPVWYENAPVGRATLHNVMKVISIYAELSMVYTNHSIRVTAVKTLDTANIEARHIQAVSGPKFAATIKTCARFCLPKEKKQMFDILCLDVENANVMTDITRLTHNPKEIN